MMIIGRTFLFITWIVTALIIAVIGLMVIRLIANSMDLNPFTWIASTIRRLSDPFIIPMRRGLMGFGIDPKYSPLVVILITILLGFFVLQITETLAYTSAGILVSIKNGSMIRVLGFIIYGAVTIYMLLIFIRIVFSWGMVSYTNRLMKFLVDTTEPLLGPLRRIIPPLGMMDISPIFAFLILWLLQSAIQGTLLRGAGPISFQVNLCLIEYEVKDGTIIFSVRVVPRASRSEIAGEQGGLLRVRITAPPVDGAANDELMRVLAKEFGVARGAISIISGHSSRLKRISVEGLTPAKLYAAVSLK